MGVVAVTSPSGATAGTNVIFWEPHCANAAYPRTFIANHQPRVLDITSLFGAEYGQFDVNLQVRNAFQPYQWFATWIVPVN